MEAKVRELSKLSEEMVVPILTRLSPKSLMRFKCVHKSWYNLINNPSFVDKHIMTSDRNNHSTSILCKRFILKDVSSEEKEIVYSLITFYNDNSGDEHITVEDIDIPSSMGVSTRGQFVGNELEAVFRIDKGHCQGLICLSDAWNTILWNPATKEFKVLPQSCIPDANMNCVGFGYDPKSKDYKVVSIRQDELGNEDARIVIYPPRVEVYTLGTDSWREIKTYNLEREVTNLWPESFQLYYKGFCYWIGREQRKEFLSQYAIVEGEDEWVRYMITFFDTTNEVFDHILLPNCLYQQEEQFSDMHVIVWKETTALFGSYRIGGPDAYGLWVMDNLGCVEVSWTKHVTLEVVEGIKKDLEFWKSDEILMIATDGRIASYNISTKKINYLSIDSIYPEYSEAVVCLNSIVSINRRQ
uniref:F-box/kelch-repeat protein At3g06240-like n=1 Tax=Fragaria vesca subsp. vesca TaxID=101020 RepID=UPI0005C97AEE|nr:PREDICTED: F-box/kelch-repeat protein At3g06240-like [Fragaria vesca subsp. vesca]